MTELGIDLRNTSDYETALSDAGLDYSAVKKPIYLENNLMIDKFWAATKSDDSEKVLGIVGDQYKAVSNKEAFAVAEELNHNGFTFETGGASVGAKNTIDYAKSFMVMKGEDFTINDDDYNSFVVLNNLFDGSSGINYQVICQRLICLNGAVRYLAGKKNQLRVRIQHTRTAKERINTAREIVMKHTHEIDAIKREAELFTNQRMTKGEFESKIIPFVIAQRGFVENNKERERGHERIDAVVRELLQAYNSDDVQNYSNSAYRIILALSDWETHSSPLRETGNRQIYYNRISKGMLITSAVAEYIANIKGLKFR